MSDQSSDSTKSLVESPAEDAVCLHCFSIIPLGASRCAKCGSYQNWRRHLTVSGTVLSLLVALVSVTGLVIPSVIDAVRGHRSILRVDLSFIDSDLAYFHFSNRGGTPGLVESLALVVGRYTVYFEIDQLGQEGDERLLRPNSGGVIRLNARQMSHNGLSVYMPSAEKEAYMDEQAQWDNWYAHEEGAFQRIAENLSKAKAKVLSGGLNAQAVDEKEWDAIDILSRDVKLALNRVQTIFPWIDQKSIREINYDDWYNPKSYKDIELILREHGSSFLDFLDLDAIERYVEANTILAFLDTVFTETGPLFIFKLRNSDGSSIEQEIPVNYSDIKHFLRPAVLNAKTVEREWIAFFE